MVNADTFQPLTIVHRSADIGTQNLATGFQNFPIEFQKFPTWVWNFRPLVQNFPTLVQKISNLGPQISDPNTFWGFYYGIPPLKPAPFFKNLGPIL